MSERCSSQTVSLYYKKSFKSMNPLRKTHILSSPSNGKESSYNNPLFSNSNNSNDNNNINNNKSNNVYHRNSNNNNSCVFDTKLLRSKQIYKFLKTSPNKPNSLRCSLPEYKLPTIMPTHNYKLQPLNLNANNDEELLDEVDDKSRNDFHVSKQIKHFFTYGNIYKTVNSNFLIDNMYKSFYAKKENKINYEQDGLITPYFKNNLFLSQTGFNENCYKSSIQNISKGIESNQTNILRYNTLKRLNRLKKIESLEKEFQSLNEVTQSENYDFGDFAYLNNKRTNYKGVKFADDNIRKIILSEDYNERVHHEVDVLFGDVKGMGNTNAKKDKEANNEGERKNKFKNIFEVMDAHNKQHMKNKKLYGGNGSEVVQFLINRYLRDTKNGFLLPFK